MGSAATEMSGSDRDINRDTSDNEEQRSDDLMSDIEATRAGMSETVDAIQAKLSPQNVQETAEQITERAKQAALEVVDQATERVKETVTQVKNEIKTEIHDATIGRVERMVGNFKDTTRGASSSLIDTVKANPIPAALVGIGLAWLFMNKSDSSSSQQRFSQGQGYGGYGQGYGQNYYAQGYNQGYDPNRYNQGGSIGTQVRNQVSNAADAVQERASHVAENVSEAADQVKEKASQFVDQAQDKVGHFSEQVQQQAHNAVNRSQNMYEDNPLMTSAIALALGAAVGFLLPETQRENELMGSARDKFVGQVSDVAQDTLGKVQNVASEALHAAGDKAKDEAEQQGLMTKPA